jgi:hypothetical protein
MNIYIYEIFLLESFGDGGVEYEKEIDFQLIKAIAIVPHFILYGQRFYSCNLL